MGRKSRSLRHGSLFSGIGGFDLAAKWMGWENVFNCELDPFCQTLLRYYFPEAIGYGDIKKTDFSAQKGNIDILTGGFPCQPYSVAGKRMGKDDERHLWPYMLRAIHQIRPQWVVAENVLGIVNWNGGVVFEEVHTDLEDAGYQVQSFVLPAAGVNAPHRRERVWFIAYRNGTGFQKTRPKEQAEGIEQPGELDPATTNPGDLGCDNGRDNRQGRSIQKNKRATPEDQSEWQERKRGTGPSGTDAPDSERIHAQDQRTERRGLGKKDRRWKAAGPEYAGVQDYWANWPTQSPVCLRNDGLPDQVDADTVFEGIPFPIKPISFSKWRIESIKALGNAIVPQVALQIFRTVQKMMDQS